MTRLRKLRRVFSRPTGRHRVSLGTLTRQWADTPHPKFDPYPGDQLAVLHNMLRERGL